MRPAGSHRAVSIFDARAPEVKDVCGYFSGSRPFVEQPWLPLWEIQADFWLPVNCRTACTRALGPSHVSKTLSSDRKSVV